MARTSQTAKRSTGGRAVRIVPGAQRPSAPPPLTQRPTPVPSAGTPDGSDQYCYMCLNGGLLILCDLCPRALCTKCISVPETVQIDRHTFLCLFCHSRMFKGQDLIPYFGFYITQGLPLLHGKPNPRALRPAISIPMQVQGTFQMTSSSHVNNEGLLILHFLLVGMGAAGSPARLLGEYLRSYLDGPSLIYEEITFDLGSDSLVTAHHQTLKSLAGRIKNMHKRVLIFITNHSHDDNGDLFLSPTLCTPVAHFMRTLLPPKEMPYLQGADVTIWMMSCGALVKSPQSYEELRVAAEQLSVSNLVAFTAAELQPCLTASFVISYGQLVLVEGCQVEEGFRRLLPSMTSICRHTDIVHIQCVKGKRLGLRYVWVHEELRPWGQTLPVQCPECRCIRSWTSANGDGGVRLFICSNSKCKKKLVFRPPAEKRWLGAEISGGRWLVVDNSRLLGPGAMMDI